MQFHRRPLPALVALALVSTAVAQRDLATMFPADSWAYAECAGLATGAATFEAAKVVEVAKQILGAEGWKTIENAIEQQAGRDLAEARGVFGRVGLEADQVRRLVSGPLAIGMGRPTMMGQNPIPSLALIAAVGDTPEAKDAVAAFERTLAERLPRPMAKTSQKVGGLDCAALALPRGAGHILHVLHDGMWFVSNSAGYLNECLASARNQTPTLAKNASLGRGRGLLNGTRIGGVFLNVQQFGHVVEPFLPYEFASIGKALGITAAPDLFAGFSHDGKGAHDVLELTLPGPTDGLLKAVFAKPVRNQAAQFVKPGTVLFASLALDADNAHQAVGRLLEALPAAWSRELRDGQIGTTLRQGNPVGELLRTAAAALGPELSIALDTPTVTPPFVNFTAYIQVRDPAATERLLQQLVQGAGLAERVKAEDVEGGKLWSTELDMHGMRMTPAIGMRDGWLVISNFKNAVKRVLRVGDLKDEALAADARFLAATKAADGAALFMTGRLQPLLNSFWGLASLGIRNGTNFLGFEPESIPSADQMVDALDDVIVTGRATAQGFTLKIAQPLGIGTLLPALSSGVDWFLGPTQGKGTPKKIY